MLKSLSGLITVRTSSTRLPNKCLLPFGDGNVIEHVIRRALAYGIDPIVCTSVDRSDDIIEKIAINEGVKSFRGSLTNKLKRWSDCASQFGLKAFHTLDGDDPFFDGNEIKKSMELLATGQYDMVCPTESSSSGGASVGYSLTAKIVNQAAADLDDETDTEMMWFYLEKIQDLKSIVLPEEDHLVNNIRLTLDYQEDYWLLETVRRVLGNLASRDEVDRLFLRNPDLYLVNSFRSQEWKSAQWAKSLD
jgi:spore coat polysaccharide biosynthesis protein SpsF (cytidylyltransferase family)